MPDHRDLDGTAAGAPPKLTVPQRLLLSLPRVHRSPDRERTPLGERLRHAVLKPVDTDAVRSPAAPSGPRSTEELAREVKYADDKERLIGLMAAPFAAVIGIMVTSALVTHDPAALLKSGAPNPRHVNPSVYHDLTAVLLGLAVLMLATAWFRKRLYLGMVMALYGLAVFNLHYWGFGVPFILFASWYLVRSYRLQRDLKAATAGGPARPGARGWRGADRPQANRRYTPPTSARGRSSLSKASRPVRAG